MRKSLIMVFVLLLATSGCRWGGCTKRAQEQCCPTDTRQMHRWLWGEDAIFDTPCGVDAAYHGHKPTCWREWQAPTTVWRDEHCGPPVAAQCNQNSGCPSTPPIIMGAVATESVQTGPTALELMPAGEKEVSPEDSGELKQPAAIDRPEPLPSLEPQATQRRPPVTTLPQLSADRRAATSQSSQRPTRLPPPTEVKPSATLASARAKLRSQPGAFTPLLSPADRYGKTSKASRPQPRRLPMGFEIAP